MEIFEYYILKVSPEGTFTKSINFDAIELKMNQLGQDGWELVGTLDVQTKGWSGDIGFMFKRKKSKPKSNLR